MRRNILISIDERYLAEMPRVVRRLEQEGLEVGSALREIGTVSGSAAAEDIAALRAVDGVASVEAERDIALPPPDAPIQ